MANKKTTSWISIIVIIVAGAGYYFYSNAPGNSKYKDYYAYYNSVSGLQPSSPVMIKGVRIGKIKSIDIGDSRVKVILSVDKEVSLPADTRARLTSGGLLADMSIVLVTGNSKSILPAGSRITSDLDTSVMPVSVRVTPYLETAKYLLRSSDSTLRGLGFLGSSGVFTSFMRPLISAQQNLKDAEIASTGWDRKISKLSGTINDYDKNAAEMAAKSRQWKGSLKNAENKSAAIAKDSLAKSLKLLADLGKSIGGVAATASNRKNAVGKLVNDKASYEHTTATLDTLNQSMKELQEHPPGFSIFGKNKKKK